MRNKLKNLTLAAMFLALGMVLPFVTGQVPQIGSMLLPMHLPVMLCGLLCGWNYGLMVGFILPLLRSTTIGMPYLFPTAIAMAFELATYGTVIGVVYAKSKWHCMKSLVRALLISMVSGRIVWGMIMSGLMSVAETPFTLSLFIAGAFTSAIPGIVIQLILIPSVMILLGKTHFIQFRR